MTKSHVHLHADNMMAYTYGKTWENTITKF